jgi:streptogramin lyase
VTRLTFFPPHNSVSRPYTIVTGPDGNLLFTESDLGKIGRITPDGTITDFPIPTPGSGPYGITIGADGNLWCQTWSGRKPANARARIRKRPNGLRIRLTVGK